MRKIRRVLVTKNTQTELEKALVGSKQLAVVDAQKLEALLPPGSVHQGIVVECEPLEQPNLQEWLASISSPHRGEVRRGAPLVPTEQVSPHPNPPPAGEGVLLLDQVSDPHNVGAILRSAAAFDIGAVIATDRNSPQESGVMAKSASGALEIVPLVSVGNLVQAVELLKKSGYWIYGLDGEAKDSISGAKFDAKTALVLGAEGKGLRRLTSEHCDFLVKIPMSNKMESLNVSNAAAVALYEVFRKLSS